MTAIALEEVYFYANDKKTCMIGWLDPFYRVPSKVLVTSGSLSCPLEIPEVDIRTLPDDWWD